MNREVIDIWLGRTILGLVLGVLIFGPLALGAVRPTEFVVLQWLLLGVLVAWMFRLWLAPTCHAGRMVKVDKGDWDKSRGPEMNHEFNTEWLKRCQKVLRPDGTIWITGTSHVIFSVGYALQQLGFKILNDIAWEKPNPPPNLSCRYFTHSTETVLWAAKTEKSRHYFNYPEMKRQNEDKQRKTVWQFTAPTKREKEFGKHPTQKPIALIERCVLASTKEGDMILDPFMGSGTTGVVAMAAHRRFFGIELNPEYVKLSVSRIAIPHRSNGESFAVEESTHGFEH